MTDTQEMTPEEKRRRRNSRIVAAGLLIAGVSVAVIDIMATKAHSQTASASSSATSRTTTAPKAVTTAQIKPNLTANTAVNSAAVQRAQRNPSLVSGVNATPAPATSAPAGTGNNNNLTAQRLPQSESASAANSSARPQLKSPAVIKKALPPAAVNWGQAVALNQRAITAKVQNPIAARLPKLQLDKTRLPVLLPRAATTLKATEAKMISFGSAYSVNLPQKPGLQIVLYGHRSLVAADKGDVTNLKRTKVTGVAEDIFLTQTEDGWTASFKRFGVVYTVDVSCDDLEAAECKDDGYIRKAIGDLTEVSLGADAVKEAVLAGVKP